MTVQLCEANTCGKISMRLRYDIKMQTSDAMINCSANKLKQNRSNAAILDSGTDVTETKVVGYSNWTLFP